MKASIKRFVCILSLFLGGFAATPGGAMGSEPYSLGVALGLTHTGAQYSREGTEGLEIAVNEINAEGGLLGKHPIQLFIRDTQTDPKVAETMAKKLITENRVRCIIGTYSSAAAQAIKPICRANKVLHIATISNAEEITKLDFSPYTFSVVPNTYMMARGLVLAVAKLAKEKGWKTYATIASDYAWGRSSQGIQIQLMRQIAREIRLVGEYWPALGETQFNAFIVDIMAKKPDFLLGTIGGVDNAYWMRDAREYRLFKQIEYPGGLISVSELIEQARSIHRGQIGRCRAPFFAHLDNPMMAGFVKAYRAKYDRFPTDWAVMSYDGVYALKQGVEKAGSIDSETVKDALSGADVDTTRGRLHFRKIDNQLSCSAYFGRVADVGAYPMPIYEDMMVFNGPDIWRPEEAVRRDRAQKQ